MYVWRMESENLALTLDKKPWHLVHRAHLHTALREKATGKYGKGKPAVLRLSSKVASIDVDQAEVTLEGGEVILGDAVLGADGVHVSSILTSISSVRVHFIRFIRNLDLRLLKT